MSYTVLARRYRSTEFDELIGQDPIARTLQNAIASGRTAHAYLFCGTRGVGKTSTARIFAKAMNADPSLQQAAEIGKAILRGDDLDVIEIDAASNRGVQEARDLIAGAVLSPARSPYKIYIIDEVHMLTRESFNTLLKTMEEPPSHVKFILCTTEPHRVPATIQSRCQRFDFRPVPWKKIADHLRNILKQEGIDAEDVVVTEVARLGNGSVRDALSLLDRLLASGEKKLTAELLEQMLGLPDHVLVRALVSAIIAADPRDALAKASALLASGATVEQALEMLADAFRNLLVARTCGADEELLGFDADVIQELVAQAKGLDAPGLVHMIALCDAAARNAHHSSIARAVFDATIVQLCMTDQLADVDSLLAGSASASTSNRKKKVAPLPEHPPAEPARRVSTPAPIPAATVEMKAASAPADAASSDDSIWEELQRRASTTPDRMRIQYVECEAFDGRTLKLRPRSGASSMALNKQAWIEQIKRTVNRDVRVEFVGETAAAAQGALPADDAGLSDVMRLPLVQKACDILEASIVGVQTIDTPNT